MLFILFYFFIRIVIIFFIYFIYFFMKSFNLILFFMKYTLSFISKDCTSSNFKKNINIFFIYFLFFLFFKTYIIINLLYCLFLFFNGCYIKSIEILNRIFIIFVISFFLGEIAFFSYINSLIFLKFLHYWLSHNYSFRDSVIFFFTNYINNLLLPDINNSIDSIINYIDFINEYPFKKYNFFIDFFSYFMYFYIVSKILFFYLFVIKWLLLLQCCIIFFYI